MKASDPKLKGLDSAAVALQSLNETLREIERISSEINAREFVETNGARASYHGRFGDAR